MYRISASEEPRLYELLEKQTKAPITNDRTILHALRSTFRDIWAVRNWLAEMGIPFEEELQ